MCLFPVVCWSQVILAHGRWLCTSLPSSLLSDVTLVLKLTILGVFTPLKSANTTKSELSPPQELAIKHLPAHYRVYYTHKLKTPWQEFMVCTLIWQIMAHTLLLVNKGKESAYNWEGREKDYSLRTVNLS